MKISKAYADRGGDVVATISRRERLFPPVEPMLEKHVALVDDIPDLDHSTIGRVLKRGRCVLI